MNSEKVLILHLGFHKTATSTIQEGLARARSVLSKQSVEYPIFKFKRMRLANHSFALFSLFCEKPCFYRFNIMNGVTKYNIEQVNKSYRRQLTNILKRNKKVILSGEDVGALPDSCLENLKQFIISYGYRIKVISFVRRPYSYYCSYLQQKVKNGEAVLNKLETVNLSVKVEKIKRIFSDATFLSYEKSCQTSVVDCFLNEVGISIPSSYFKRSNTGICNLSTRLFDHLNHANPKIINGEVNPNWIKPIALNVSDERFLLTKMEYLKAAQGLKEENERFRELLGPEFCDTNYSTSAKLQLDKNTVISILKSLPLSALMKRPLARFFAKYGIEDLSNVIDQYGIKQADPKVQKILELDDDLIELFRDAALQLENISVEKAYQLMSLAQKGRPNGPLIQKKIKDYQKELSE